MSAVWLSHGDVGLGSEHQKASAGHQAHLYYFVGFPAVFHWRDTVRSNGRGLACKRAVLLSVQVPCSLNIPT